LRALPTTPELAKRLMGHNQTIAHALKGLDQVLGSLGPEPVQIKQNVRIDCDNRLTESGVELVRGRDPEADELSVIQPVHEEILPA
jgi:hypothetical protein